MGHLALRRAVTAGLAAVSCIASGGVAHAELGAPVASVATDRGRMNARLTSQPRGPYRRHELTRVNGGMVREFSNADGKVFAVSWSGPGKPDLRTLLGPSFAALQADASDARAMHALRRPTRIERGDLRIQAGGHMGWFHGIAVIPSLVPAGVSTSELGDQP